MTVMKTSGILWQATTSGSAAGATGTWCKQTQISLTMTKSKFKKVKRVADSNDISNFSSCFLQILRRANAQNQLTIS